MNKNILNTVLAFLLILLSVNFFFSEFYYEKILKQPYPFIKKGHEEKTTEVVTEQRKTEDVEKEIYMKPNEQKKETLENITIDTLKDSLPQTQEKADTIWIETDKYICGITEEGGRIITCKVKEFKYYRKDIEGENIELCYDSERGGANLTINDQNYDKMIFKTEYGQKQIKVSDTKTIRFVHDDKKNAAIIKEFKFTKDSYTIGYSIYSEELDGKSIRCGWFAGITESELREDEKSLQYDPTQVHVYDGKNVEHIIMKKRGKDEQTGFFNWISITSKYFLIAMIPEEIKDADIVLEGFYIKDTSEYEKKKEVINYKIEIKRFATGKRESYLLYMGPSKINELRKLDIGLQKVLFKGYRWFLWADKWFPALCEAVLWLLIELQKGVKDYGIVIIILTIILKIVTNPLTISSMKSMEKMKEIQPKINKIREKYKSNTQQMNQKIMEFYREEGINPMGGMSGCLPMVLQMPIMISLFIVLRKAIELRGQGTVLVPWIDDLSQAEVLFPIGINIPFYGSNFALLPVIMAILMFYQQKMTIKDPNQKMMIYMMPIMMLVLFNNFPSGLGLYFTFSTALQLLQQIQMERKKLKKLQTTEKKQ